MSTRSSAESRCSARASANATTTAGAAGPTPPGACSAYIVVDEPDALCDRVRAAGAEITIDLHDTDYGSRDFGIRDPEGNRWYFGTYRGAPPRVLIHIVFAEAAHSSQR
jgi:uncharacterized glyoxalase superfamily protein PhnB